MTHIMLDIETWGKHPGCDIRSIGAVMFDPENGFVGGFDDFEGIDRTFYIATDNPLIMRDPGDYCDTCGAEWPEQDVYRYTLDRDPETVKWWSEQSPEAQGAFENPVDLKDALRRFSDWLLNVTLPNRDSREIVPTHERRDIRIWANDPHFDVSILDATYRAVGLTVPWHYRAPRSMKTVTDLAGLTRKEYCNYGDAHNALHDAIAQAMTVNLAYKRMGLKK